jgi:hypothetical protein
MATERQIKIHRTYYLGQFKNIRIESGISSIPESLWVNPEAMDLLGSLLLIYVERDFRKYQALLEQVGTLSLEDSLALLDKMRDEVYKEVQQLLQNGEAESNLEGEQDE